MSDPVNRPAHYDLGNGRQVIDIIRDSLTEEEFRGFLKGNILKYLSREGKKTPGSEDLLKAHWYLMKLIELGSDEAGGGSIG